MNHVDCCGANPLRIVRTAPDRFRIARSKHGSEALERALVRFEIRLLRDLWIRVVKRRGTHHGPHTEHLQQGLLVAQDRDPFVRVNLRLVARA